MARVRFVATIATLARTGIIAGLVVAALVYPLAAIAGLGVKRGADRDRRRRQQAQDRPAVAGLQDLRRRRQDADHPVLRGVPDPGLDRGDLAAHAARDRRRRGRPVLRAQRRRRARHRPGVRRQPAGRRGVAGRVDDHDAVRADVAARLGRDPGRGVRRHRADAAPASCARCGWRSTWRSSSAKAGDPGALPERGVLRAPGVRHPGRRRGVLLQAGQRADRRRGRRCSPGWCRRRRRTTRRAPTRPRRTAGATTSSTGWRRPGT